MKALKSFSNLPLGARFQYPGNDRIYTILEQYRKIDNAPLSGTIAVWQSDMVAKTPATFNATQPHAGCWHGQEIFSHIPVEVGGDCPDMVIPID